MLISKKANHTFFVIRAIQESLALYQGSVGSSSREGEMNNAEDDEEGSESLEGAAEQLRIALRLSKQQQAEEEERRLLEEETFRQVLELSLTDK